jgi:hypothetical protein
MNKKIAKILAVGGLAVSALVAPFGNVLAEGTTNFKDVDMYHTYAKEIQYLKDRNITQGFSDGNYKPAEKIDRKSLVTLLIKAKYSIEEINNCISENGFEGQNIFEDIPSNHHFAPFICMAKVKQISAGYSDDTFKPDVNTELKPANTLIMRVLDGNLTIPEGSSLDTYLNRLKEKGAFPIPTVGESFEGKELNRGEIAYLIQVIHNNYVQLPPEPEREGYTFMIKPKQTHTWNEENMTIAVRNFGIHCTTTKNTFIDLSLTKDGKSQLIHLERTCTGISNSIIKGESTHEADAFGFHFKLEQVKEPVAWDITKFEYTVSVK